MASYNEIGYSSDKNNNEYHLLPAKFSFVNNKSLLIEQQTSFCNLAKLLSTSKVKMYDCLKTQRVVGEMKDLMVLTMNLGRMSNQKMH